MKNIKKYKLFVILLIFGISVGYAALNTTLKITGKSNISKNTWNVYFDNITITDGSVKAVKVPTINNKTTLDFEVKLNIPGDYYEFTVDVVNDGTIDAMIENIEKIPTLTTEQQKYLNYTIEYQNKEKVVPKQLVKANEFVRYKVRIEIKKDITSSDLPENIDVLNLGFTVNYIQSDDLGIDVKDNGVQYIFANGDINEMGTIVTIGTEQFYTIGTEEDTVSLLSMYNLQVGGRFDYAKYEWTKYNNPTTGMQDKNMKGLIDSSVPCEGTTKYSEKSALYEGSIVEKYVNEYKIKLEERFGVVIEKTRLIELDELRDPKIFGCSTQGYEYCKSSPYPWIYSTTYWTQSTFGEDLVWYVATNGVMTFVSYDSPKDSGVRPVIVISTEYF